jgi:hypothetical protein
MSARPPVSATGGVAGGRPSITATDGATEVETVHEPQPVAAVGGRGRVAGAEHTLFGGYGPFVALVALILAMALLAPTIAPERDVTTRPGPASPPSSLSGNTPDRWRSSATGGVAEERHLGDNAAEGAQR